MKTFLLTAKIDDRDGRGKIRSRIGIEHGAEVFDENTNIDSLIQHRDEEIDCILVDEAQFLTKKQVGQLASVVDKRGIPVLTYGIRTDFLGETFEGSQYLMAWADEIKEIKTICHCGKKATMNARIDPSGKMETSGAQIEVGGNERYVSLCRNCFGKADTGISQD